MSSKKNYIEVVKCGTKATTKMSQIEGIVTGISIRFNRATYEISYFHNGEYKSVWLDESEFEIGECLKGRIGFK